MYVKSTFQKVNLNVFLLYMYLSSFKFEYLKYLKFCYYSLEFLDYAAKLKVISIVFDR